MQSGLRSGLLTDDNIGAVVVSNILGQFLQAPDDDYL